MPTSEVRTWGDGLFRAVPWGSQAACCGCVIEVLSRPGDDWMVCACYCHDVAHIFKEKKQ